MNEQPSCTCDLFVHPAPIGNLPGLPVLVYRLGDFSSFRRALLLARSGETELGQWRPGGGGDLAVQLVEWWAVLADILTFYNERAIHEAFLRTADLPEAVTNLVRLLGYRPRPGIAAVGTVAALVSGKKPVTLPKGFQIQSKPGPGKEPQIFEADADTVASLPDEVDVDPSPDPHLFKLDSGHSSLLLSGNITSIKDGDRFLLRRRVWNGSSSQALLVTVQETKKEKSPRGVKNTRVVFTQNHGLTGELANNWLLLRSTQSAALFTTANVPILNISFEFEIGLSSLAVASAEVAAAPIARAAFSPGAERASSSVSPTSAGAAVTNAGPGGQVGILIGGLFGGGGATVGPTTGGSGIGTGPTIGVGPVAGGATVLRPVSAHAIHLESVRTPIDPGDALLLERPGDVRISYVQSHLRDVWYQNASPSSPQTPPASPNVPIPVLHSVIKINPFFTESDRSSWNSNSAEVKVGYAWIDIGTIIGTPSTTFSPTSATATLLAAEPDAARLAGQTNVLLADANGIGTRARVTTANAAQVSLESIETISQSLVAPLQLLANLAGVSRGKTVANEVLGSGDATRSGQEFLLKKSPLTYLQSGDSYVSTLRVYVDGVEWKEVDSFYGQAADGKIFVTKEDAEAKTHVLFGDGINGARLPSGTNNIVGSYRYGSGAELPEAGTLTVILKPQPGVRGIRNPIAPFGGSDPDAAEKIRAYAPRSVLTFGRAVSADDYEVIAAGAPGVARARATWVFDPAQQRAMVTVYVGDDEGAADSARAAIALSHDPNQRVEIVRAEPVACSVQLTIVVSSDRIPDTVAANVRTALEDKDGGLFGTNVIRIGQVIYDSQIHGACLAVAGTVAVHSFIFRRGSVIETNPRHDPGTGHFFRLTALTLTSEQA